MSENRAKSKDVIEAELQKTKKELAIAKHRQAKLRNQITLNDDTVKDILNTLFSELYFRRTMQNILAEKAKPQSLTEMNKEHS